jgi:hypothetical protein
VAGDCGVISDGKSHMGNKVGAILRGAKKKNPW